LFQQSFGLDTINVIRALLTCTGSYVITWYERLTGRVENESFSAWTDDLLGVLDGARGIKLYVEVINIWMRFAVLTLISSRAQSMYRG
jgi:hypothetical protein